jgi:hypothetical protein
VNEDQIRGIIREEIGLAIKAIGKSIEWRDHYRDCAPVIDAVDSLIHDIDRNGYVATLISYGLISEKEGNE